MTFVLHGELHIFSSHKKHSTSYEIISFRLSVVSGLDHLMVTSVLVLLISIIGLSFNLGRPRKE